jgi:hypothetical protein
MVMTCRSVLSLASKVLLLLLLALDENATCAINLQLLQWTERYVSVVRSIIKMIVCLV